jgi:hypothetical protein
MPKETTQALLKRIKQNAPPAAEQQKAIEPAPADPKGAEPAAPQFTGKAVAFWLDDEDRAILKQMRVLFVTQDLTPSDSLVVRTALRFLPKDPQQIIEKARELSERDGRKVRHQKRGS